MYDKLVETAKAQAAVVTPEEESDMEASDVEDEVPNVHSDSLPLGTTFRTIHLVQQEKEEQKPKITPRKLSTISSQEENEAKTTEAEVHAKLLNTTDFEWHPEQKDEDPESEALLSAEQENKATVTSRYKNTHV